MTDTLESPATTDATADVRHAMHRLMILSGDPRPMLTKREEYRPDSRQDIWSAIAHVGAAVIAGGDAASPGIAVDLWLKESRGKRESLAAMLNDLDHANVNNLAPALAAGHELAREPYDARSPNAEERERVAFDESNVGERHDGGPL